MRASSGSSPTLSAVSLRDLARDAGYGRGVEQASPQPKPTPLRVRLLLIGGGLLAAWGTLVSAGIVFVAATRGPGSGGYTPLVLGGLVIGASPIFCGAMLFCIGLNQRKRERSSSR